MDVVFRFAPFRVRNAAVVLVVVVLVVVLVVVALVAVRVLSLVVVVNDANDQNEATVENVKVGPSEFGRCVIWGNLDS